MVRYEIGPWEGGQKNEHTDKQTNRQRLANYNIDIAHCGRIFVVVTCKIKMLESF